MSQSGANAEPSMEEILASIRQIISDDEPADRSEPEASADGAEDAAEENISEADLDALFSSDSSEADSDAPAASADAPAAVESEPADTNQIDFDAIDIGDDDPEPTADVQPEAEPAVEEEEVLDLGEVGQALADPFEPEIDIDFAESEAAVSTAEDEPMAEAFVEPEPVQAREEPTAAAPPRAEIEVNAQSLLSNDASQAVSVAFADLASTMLSGNARTIEDLVQDMLRPMLKSWLDENLPTMVEKMVREEIERVARRGPRG
ncbi:MAG: DUF2497 domain-containing protein [Pseudomonadota bacterium]